MWRAVKYTLVTLFFLAVLGAGLGFVAVQARGDRLLSVQTGSMAPHIAKGSLVAVTRVPLKRLAVGDVVTYIDPRNAQKTITHRIIALPPGHVVTKGDANPSADPTISRASVLGRVRFSLPYVGRVLDFLRRPIGLLLVVYIPALAVIIDEYRRLAAHYRSQRPYRAAGYSRTYGQQPATKQRIGAALGACVAVSVLATTNQAQATLFSQVRLAGNTIATGRLHHCSSANNTTDLHITNTNTQTATSGNANGESATSGTAGNTNATNITINVTNC